MAKRKKKGSSGFLFMFIMIAILGIIVFIYKDNFLVYMNMLFNSGKEFVENKTENNPVGEFFKNIPFINKEKKDDKREIVRDKIKLDEEKKKKEIRKKKFKEEKPVIEKTIPVKEAIKEIVKKTAEINDEKTVKKTAIAEKTEGPKKEITKNIKSKNETIKNENQVKIIPEKKSNSYDGIKNREFRIFFNRINNKEELVMTSVSRNVKYTDSPLTETLKMLLSGPNSSEKENDILTNIPDNSKIISVKVKDSVAYINFSKEFEYNKYGRESTLNQLKQIVFTATEFPTVKKVQFLIEGRVKNYLGGEGVIIDHPLSRNDFS